jgi:ADP-ribosylglycohydrolase
MKKQLMRRKVMAYEHLAMAVAYADAKGLPYESKSKQEIEKLGGVSDNLIPPDSFSGSFPDFIDKPIGTWKDDTQHTLVMMNC